MPILILFLAALASSLVAYGTHPAWVRFARGMDLIIFARQYQWPLAAVGLMLCLVLVGLVVAGRRRAWWLIGLAPVLALYVHRFHRDPMSQYRILDQPGFVAAEAATFLDDSDYVVGVVFNGSAFAYPYFSLYAAPIVFQADHDKRLVLFWSAFANRGVACSVNDQLHARDVEIVSIPANGLLLYNRRLGQFISALTGRTPRNDRVVGLGPSIPTCKQTWGQWRAAHPQTRVLAALGEERLPDSPIRPWYSLPPSDSDIPHDTSIVLVEATPPVAIPTAAIGREPMNLAAPDVPLAVWRDQATGRVRAYDRRVDDLTLNFKLNSNSRRERVFMVDRESNSGWTAEGRAIDGPLGRAEKRLKALPVDEQLTWGVMKAAMPDLSFLRPAEPVRLTP